LPDLVQARKEQLDMLEAWENSTRGERQMRAATKAISFCFSFRELLNSYPANVFYRGPHTKPGHKLGHEVRMYPPTS